MWPSCARAWRDHGSVARAFHDGDAASGRFPADGRVICRTVGRAKASCCQSGSGHGTSVSDAGETSSLAPHSRAKARIASSSSTPFAWHASCTRAPPDAFVSVGSSELSTLFVWRGWKTPPFRWGCGRSRRAVQARSAVLVRDLRIFCGSIVGNSGVESSDPGVVQGLRRQSRGGAASGAGRRGLDGVRWRRIDLIRASFFPEATAKRLLADGGSGGFGEGCASLAGEEGERERFMVRGPTR